MIIKNNKSKILLYKTCNVRALNRDDHKVADTFAGSHGETYRMYTNAQNTNTNTNVQKYACTHTQLLREANI